MASTIIERYSWNVTVTRSGSPVSGVRVVGFNAADSLVVDVDTNASGQFASDAKVEAASISIDGAPGTSVITDRNPYDIRFLNYADRIIQFGKTFDAASTDSAFLQNDDVITESNQATVQGYTGIVFTHGSDLITLSAGTWDRDRLYDRCKDEAVENPQGTPLTFVDSVDGVNFTNDYAIRVQNITFDAAGGSYSGEFQTDTGGAINNITVGILESSGPSEQLTLTNVNVTTQYIINDANTYNLVGGTYADANNASGSAVTLQLTNGAVVTITSGTPPPTIVQSVTITVTAIDADTGSPVEGAAVYIETTTAVEVLNAETDALGVASASFGGTTPATIDDTVSGVKSGSDAKPYVYFTLAGTIEPGTGYSATALLTED